MGVITVILDNGILEKNSAMLFNIVNNIFKILNINLNGITVATKPKIIIIPIKKLTIIFENKNVNDILLKKNMFNGNIIICTAIEIAIICSILTIKFFSILFSFLSICLTLSCNFNIVS